MAKGRMMPKVNHSTVQPTVKLQEASNKDEAG